MVSSLFCQHHARRKSNSYPRSQAAIGKCFVLVRVRVSGEIGCRLCLAIYFSLLVWPVFGNVSVSLDITGRDCVSDLNSLTCPASLVVLVLFPTDSSSKQDGTTSDADASNWQLSFSCLPSEPDSVCSWFPSVKQLLTGFHPYSSLSDRHALLCSWNSVLSGSGSTKGSPYQFTGTFPFFTSTTLEPTTTPIVSANMGRHSTAQTLFCADFPCMASLMSTSASISLRDPGGMVRVFPILILQHPFLAFSPCRTTLSLPKLIWPWPTFRVTSWSSMQLSPRKAVCSHSSATTTVSRNSCPPTLSWTSTSPRVTNSEPSAIRYVSITGLNSRCCLRAKDSYTDTSIMEVEALESTKKVKSCSFTSVAACFWIVGTCAVRTCAVWTTGWNNGLLSSPYLFNGATVWLSFCELYFILFPFTSPLLLGQFLAIWSENMSNR